MLHLFWFNLGNFHGMQILFGNILHEILILVLNRSKHSSNKHTLLSESELEQNLINILLKASP